MTVDEPDGIWERIKACFGQRKSSDYTVQARVESRGQKRPEDTEQIHTIAFDILPPNPEWVKTTKLTDAEELCKRLGIQCIDENANINDKIPKLFYEKDWDRYNEDPRTIQRRANEVQQDTMSRDLLMKKDKTSSIADAAEEDADQKKDDETDQGGQEENVDAGVHSVGSSILAGQSPASTPTSNTNTDDVTAESDE